MSFRVYFSQLVPCQTFDELPTLDNTMITRF
jgi:hypothetical protein